MRIVVPVALLMVLGGCSREKPAQPEAAKSQREKDSVLANSKVPGASGVGKAMTVADSAGNRVHVQDSVASE